jgi:hypothetical protein
MLRYSCTFFFLNFDLRVFILPFFFEFLTQFLTCLYQRGAALEIYVSKAVHVNGKVLDKTAKVTLVGGDEVIFSSLGRHAYVSFHHQLPLHKCCLYWHLFH